MEAIVLAGGFGMRLRDVVPDLPKPMAPVAGKPFLEILLSELARKKFQRIILSLGFMSETIITHFGEQFEGIELIYEIEKEQLGTGGACRQAIHNCRSDHVFIFNGDTYLDLEVEQVERYWLDTEVPIVVAKEVSDAARYGRLSVKNGQIIGFSEKNLDGPGLISAGCYVLPTNALKEFDVGKPFSLETDYLTSVVGKERFDVFVTKGYFIDIGVPEDYARAQVELAGY